MTSAIDQATIKQVIQGVFTALASEAQRCPQEIPRVLQRLSRIEEVVGSLGSGSLWIVVGESQARRKLTTALALDYLRFGSAEADPCEDERAVLWISSTCAKPRVGLELISAASGVELGSLTKGHLSRDHWGDVTAAAATLAKLDLFVADPLKAHVSALPSACEQHPNLGLLVVDGFERLDGAGDESLCLEVTAALRGQSISMICVLGDEEPVPSSRDAWADGDVRVLRSRAGLVGAADAVLFAGSGDDGLVVPGVVRVPIVAIRPSVGVSARLELTVHGKCESACVERMPDATLRR